MHEAGIAQRVIAACARHLLRAAPRRPRASACGSWALACVDPDALRFCFDNLKAATPLAAATLQIEWRSRFGCACESTPVLLAAPPGVCPSCGAAESFADACALDIRHLEFDEGGEGDAQPTA
jgi:hydrogenase nickel incorporation protein HypA/HybF